MLTWEEWPHCPLGVLTCAIMHLKTGLDCHLASETITVSCRCTTSSELSFLFGVHRDISNGIAPFKTKETRITDLLSLWLLNNNQITLLCCIRVPSDSTLRRSHPVLFSFCSHGYHEWRLFLPPCTHLSGADLSVVNLAASIHMSPDVTPSLCTDLLRLFCNFYSTTRFYLLYT